LRPLAAFENRLQRGRELVEVLDLAGEFPSRHRSLSRRFPVT